MLVARLDNRESLSRYSDAAGTRTTLKSSNIADWRPKKYCIFCNMELLEHPIKYNKILWAKSISDLIKFRVIWHHCHDIKPGLLTRFTKPVGLGRYSTRLCVSWTIFSMMHRKHQSCNLSGMYIHDHT